MRLPRATHLVILARYMGSRIVSWVEGKLEKELGLEVNRDKTSIVRMAEQGETLDFLGFTLRYDRDLKGRDRRYLNIFPSEKAVRRLRDKVRAKTLSGYKKPLLEVIKEVNVILRGWANYYRYGYPRKVFRDCEPLCAMSVRAISFESEPTAQQAIYWQGESLYAGLKRYGLIYL